MMKSAYHLSCRIITFCMVIVIFITLPFASYGQKDQTSSSKKKNRIEQQKPESSSPTDTITMEQVVVTATRTDSRLFDTPVRINTITSSTLATLPSLSVDDALRYTSGLNVNRSFGILSTKATVTMRGLSAKEQGRVLVLLDGIPLNKSDGGTVDWNMIDMSNLQRIEVTKGAGSAIYGGSAMGGIINIISNVPVEKFKMKASLEYGSFNTVGARVSTSGSMQLSKKDNRFYWGVNSLFRKSDGYITQSEVDRKENPYIIKSNMQEAGINIRTGISLHKKHTLEASIKYYNDRRGTGEKVYQPEGNTTDHDSYGITLNYKGKFDNLSIRSSAYFLNEDYKKVNEYRKDDYTWYNVLSTRADMGWLNSLTIPFRNHNFTTGVDMKLGSVDGEDVYLTSTDVVYNRGKIFTFSAFVQDEWTLTEKLRVLAGLRYDNATFYDGAFYITEPSSETEFMFSYQVPEMQVKHWNAFSPRLSMQYKFTENTRVYAMVSRGFRPSELEYLCRSGRIKGGFKMASPSLEPEYLNNFETGIDLVPFKNFSLALSAYYSKGKNFQYYVSNGQTIDMGFGERPIFIRDNITNVNITGAETELQYTITGGILFTASYAWAHSKIVNYTAVMPTDTVNLDGMFFTDVPEHIATAGIRMINRFINGSVNVRYTGAMYINDQNTVDEIIGSDMYPAYTTTDIKIWKELGKFRVSLGVQNLFDIKFYDSKYAVGPGRFILGGIEYNI